jgi:membrane protein implicated in regulation of membrane protease activity
MRDRDLAPVALVAALVCCGAMALTVGLVGGVALAAIGRFTAVSVAGLGVVVAAAWWLDRRRHRHDRTGATNDRSTHPEGTAR